jgi:hypothetical protein
MSAILTGFSTLSRRTATIVTQPIKYDLVTKASIINTGFKATVSAGTSLNSSWLIKATSNLSNRAIHSTTPVMKNLLDTPSKDSNIELDAVEVTTDSKEKKPPFEIFVMDFRIPEAEIGKEYKKNNKKTTSEGKRLAKIFGMSLAAYGAVDLATYVDQQLKQVITGEGEFFDHARNQHTKHWFREQHEPFFTQDKELLDLFYSNYPELAHLMPKDAEFLANQMAIKTPVKLKPLSESPVPYNASDSHIIGAGGPPALIGMALLTMLAKKNNIELNLAYINDERQRPIWYGSAFHIENDADGEAPTGTTPVQFMIKQIRRALYARVSYAEIQKTGEYPWRNVDWIGILKNPSQWLAAIKVAINFQLEKAEGDLRKLQLLDIAKECNNNEKLYDELNEALGGKLLLPGKGGIIGAQTPAQVRELEAQKKSLASEGRELRTLSKEEVGKYPINGIAFAEKTHDRVLSPDAFDLLKNYLKENGGKVINGIVLNDYADNKNANSVVHYQTPDGEEHFLSSHFQMTSYGKQPVIGFDNTPVNDNVTAKGTSGIAAIFTPVGTILPRVFVPRAGESDHWPLLSKKPCVVNYQGEVCEMHILRFTSTATIGPLEQGAEGAWYDGFSSVGSMTALRDAFNSTCKIKPLVMLGCPRVVSKHMQTKTTEVAPGIFDQNGGGGGALTRAPKFITYLQQNKKINGIICSADKKKDEKNRKLGIYKTVFPITG